MMHTHLTALEASVAHFSSLPAFKIPSVITHDVAQSWRTITYEQFFEDVKIIAKHWTKVLIADGISLNSRIGLWVAGWSYVDMVTLYGLSMAGYVPQAIGLRLSDPNIIFDLLKKAEAKALIRDSSVSISFEEWPVIVHSIVNAESIGNIPNIQLPILTTNGSPDDILFVFHTSGSTSGIPKLVPYSRRWMDSNLKKSWEICHPKRQGIQDVTTWLGSVCHMAQNVFFMGFTQHGTCTVIPSRQAFSSEELVNMINHCGLNRLNQITSLLTTHLEKAQSDVTLLSKLKALDEILYFAIDLPLQYQDWAYSNSLALKNIYGSTECGAMLQSGGSRQTPMPNLLRPFATDVFYDFVPLEDAATGRKLLELVVRGHSADRPHQTLLSADGHFHTGDLFEELHPGHYAFRGRSEDWIKTQLGLRCDTRAIEVAVKTMCSELVVDCVVVGAGRPWLALIVESVMESKDPAMFKAQIIERIQPFQARQNPHEQIRLEAILVVNRGILLRTATKGNIRRQAVETAFKPTLDAMYGEACLA